MMVKRFNIFQALWFSFYSAPLYRDVGRQWKGAGTLYLLLLLALMWIPEMVHFQGTLAAFVEGEGRAFANQLPTITITDGEVSTDVETPYFIRDPKTNQVWAIVDLTGEYTSLQGTDAKLLLTRNQLLMSRDRGTIHETRVYDLSGVESFTLDRSRVMGWLELVASWLAILAYPVALLFSFIYRIVQVLIYAAIGLLIARSTKVGLDYVALMRLTAVAITPAVVVDTVRSVAEISIPVWWLLAFAITMGYLTFAIKANATVPDPFQPTAEPVP
jgi:hypothetical protein